MPRSGRTTWIAAAAVAVLAAAGAGVFLSQQGAPTTSVAAPPLAPAVAPAASPVAPVATPAAMAAPQPATPQAATAMAGSTRPVAAPPPNPAGPTLASAAAPTAPASPVPAAWKKLPQPVQKRLAEHQAWFENTPNDRWFIQLLGTDSSQARRIEALLARADALLDPAQVRVYFVPLRGSERMGVIYGDFADRAAALDALKTLPAELRPYQPFPRQMTKLR
jgi:septal ring-binding cell division protein DamX